MVLSCNKGLEPPPAPAEWNIIRGIVRFAQGKNNWPPADSVKSIRIVAFQNYPPQNILTEVLNGTAYFTPGINDDLIPTPADSIIFSISLPTTNPPKEIRYIAVAQQLSDAVTTPNAWRVVGIYTTSGNLSQPSGFGIQEGVATPFVEITVDFQKLPPQPF